MTDRRRSFVLTAVVVALLVGLVATLDWRAVLRDLTAADPLLYALGVGAVLVAVASLTEAHRRMLRSVGAGFSPGRCFVLYVAALFARLALPVGYAVSVLLLAYLFERESTLSYEESLATVSAAESLSVAASGAIAIGGVALLLADAPASPLVRRLAGSVLLVGALAALGLGALWLGRRRLRPVLPAVDRRLAAAADRVGLTRSPPGLAPAIDGFVGTLELLTTRRRTVGTAVALSAVAWAGFVGALLASALALGHRLPIGVALFVVPVAGYTNVLPIPGGLGGYELALTGTVYALAGLDLSAAVAVTLLFRLSTYWLPLVGGALASAYLSIDARRLAMDLDADAPPSG